MGIGSLGLVSSQARGPERVPLGTLGCSGIVVCFEGGEGLARDGGVVVREKGRCGVWEDCC